MRTVLLTVLLAALAAAPAASGAPPSAPGQPRQVPVPAAVVAAHPHGAPVSGTGTGAGMGAGGAAVASPLYGERINCWRVFLTMDNSGWFGTEQETVNPYWCGNGSVLRGVDSSWHYQSCTLLVSCNGESGPFGWFGCTYGCSSYGGEIIGRFTVNIFLGARVDLTVLYELYGDGSWWGYYYHD